MLPNTCLFKTHSKIYKKLFNHAGIIKFQNLPNVKSLRHRKLKYHINILVFSTFLSNDHNHFQNILKHIFMFSSARRNNTVDFAIKRKSFLLCILCI